MHDQPWPQPLKFTGILCFVMLTALSIAIIVECFRRAILGDVEFALGFGGGACTLALVAVIALHDSGIRHIGLPPGITLYHDPHHGTGVTIPGKRWVNRILVAAPIGISMYGTAAAVAWATGHGDAFMPFGRNTAGGAVYLASGSVVLITVALFVATSRLDTTVRIYPDGIERITARRILLITQRTRVFLSWNDIARIDVGNLGVGFRSTSFPVIDLHTVSTLADEQRVPPHDTDNKVTIMA
ncbi:MAG: hypothetical protein GX610_07045, partial [Rhodococcus sp.]|nr:hypothetical protein [Rhodococcus sp. (in: high G+C Gram-positive bacteria)]